MSFTSYIFSHRFCPNQGKGNKNLYVHKFDEEEIAFGLKALKAFVIMPGDYAGGTQPIEDAFAKVQGVGQVDVEVVQTLPG